MKRILTDGGDTGPSFDLPIENELLILKLKAEFGAECTTGKVNIPPEVINEFLTSVYEFEQQFREHRSTVRVFDKLGRPSVVAEEAIPDANINAELRKLKQLLNAHQLELDVLGDYPDRLIYKFITEEFLYQEIDDLELNGYMHHFCYEDFHPNYALEIRQRAVEFITRWFRREASEISWQLAELMIHADSREFPREQVLKGIRNLFQAYETFSDCSYIIRDVQVDWNDETQCGRGFVRGEIRYNAYTESGECIGYEGPLELYLSNIAATWTIFYFVCPGFAW